MDAYVADAEGGRAEAEGWPDWVNLPSKVGRVAVTVLGRAADGALAPGALINAACPA